MVIKIILILDLILINLGIGWLFYKSRQPVIVQNIISKTEYVDREPVVVPTPVSTPITITKTVYQTAPKTKTRSVVYIPIPGSGFTTNNTWSDLSGTDFYFNKSDYPGIIDVAFEANLRLFNGNGTAYVQIFDVTHSVGVQGSDVSTTSQTSTAVISGSVSFWAGKNLYRIQAKSLTADTAMFDGGRLKLTLEQ